MPFKDSPEGQTHHYGDGCFPPHREPGKKVHTIFIRIKTNFGSDFQQQFNLQALEAMMQAWLYSVKGSHQKNKVEADIIYNEKEL